MRPPVAAVLAVVAALLLSGCGSADDIRGYLSERYELHGRSGDTATYNAIGSPVGPTTAAIVGAFPPAARAADGGSEYLRYDDDIVVVSAIPQGSAILVEDLDDGYRSGRYRHLGPGFDPGSPAGGDTDGGPGDGK
jgi:Domain of unknown function (DUF4247)